MMSQSGLKFIEPLIFEKSVKGKTGYSLSKTNASGINLEDIFDPKYIRDEIEDFPELSENEVVRHFTRLSQWNYGVDSGIYPLGSCTMKYNPKVNEEIARFRGFTNIHPYFPDSYIQGALEVLWNLQESLKEITGFKGVSLQPSAGAHSEFTGLKIMKAYLDSKGSKRDTILIPDTAHGTNPASAILAGFKVKNVKSSEDGYLTLELLQDVFDDSIAGIMITNPNTIGIYEHELEEIISFLHKHGALVYADGANMNALMGKVRPGDLGVDVMHLNLHKTFSTPHGGGGPGSGPILVSEELVQFLPVPVIKKDENSFKIKTNMPKTIGRVKSFMGNFLVNIRAYAYILEMGEKGLTQATEDAVLSANYIRSSLTPYYHLPYKTDSLHEVVFSDEKFHNLGVKTLDVAKRLIDYGIHPPTVYFPLIVSGAIMIEPTESESKESLDYLIDSMIKISKEIKNREIGKLVEAPKITVRGRLDEVRAAKRPILRWLPKK